LSGIPKRPAETHLPDGSIESGDLFEILAHQHAVAKRACAALEAIRDAPEGWEALAKVALREIDASGWKPT
jgi:hypothetical protein